MVVILMHMSYNVNITARSRPWPYYEYTTGPSNGAMLCTGYHFEANTFTNNFGC